MKRLAITILIIFFIASLSFIILAEPQPHNVAGTVFHKSGAYATGGIPLKINNTINRDVTWARTNGMGPPFIDAAYSATINGSDGELVMVIAWNATYYGFNSSILAPTTTYLNIVLNTTRPSETNVSIIVPSNSQRFNISDYFNVTANIGIIGGASGESCTATIIFSDNQVLRTLETQTLDLGAISLGANTLASWNVSGNFTGASNITVEASCTSGGISFNNASSRIVYNITVEDTQPPIVSLMLPLNNSIVTIAGAPIYFWYNVSDPSPISNCSLVINGKINKTNYTVTRGIPQFIGAELDNDTYSWSINCTENSTSSNIGSSTVFNLTIIENKAPAISNMAIMPQIDLNIGSTLMVICNASVTDENNVSDISSINSTFFHIAKVGGYDNNNDHYTNSSCLNLSVSKYEINVSCSFEVYYYADNGTWQCNITAVDANSLQGADNKSTYVNQLLALEVAPSLIDYGALEAGDFSLSDFKMNITNLGNVDFNISVKGYGQSEGDNISMNCTRGNISLFYEKYSVEPAMAYANMVNLTNESVVVGNMTLPQRTDDTTFKNDRNFTYWKMGIPYGIQGVCSGFVNFLSVQV